ncbi:MAG: NAD(P)/FAD-dependent oxidoreductase [Rhodospirillales bacterium]|nr:NAD(P)/FAD-dependent oxidoreductase [Rhodospirillales bacterium]
MAGGTTSDYDVIVIGAGHNGLTCAGYLARAGLKVKVVERRHVVGGAAVTEEFHPGFRNSVCSYVVSLLNPGVIRDLELERHGLTILDRDSGSFAALPDGQYLQVARDPALARAEIAKFSAKDAAAYDAFDAEIGEMAELLREIVLQPAPNLGGGWPDLWQALKLGNRLRRLQAKQQATLAELMTMSVGDYLERWFESDPLKGVFAFEGIVGNMVSPYHPGTAYVLLHHAFGEVNGRTAAWGHAKGGMGAITQAMARSAEAHGAEIEVLAPVREVIVEGGPGAARAKGVVLEDGRSLRARLVSANTDPKLLFLKLLDPGLLPEDFRRRMAGWRCRSGSFRMNVALSELPRFCGLSEEEARPKLNGTIDICPSIAYAERAYDDAKAGAWSSEPVISMCLPSLLDDSLAPAGCHVMSLFCQHFNPELSDGRSWDDVKEQVADLVIETVTRAAPNFRQAVVGRQVLSPLDLEREFGLTGGDIFHGALHLDQIYSLRPAAGYADYRMPVKGLYLCGSGTHPGGGVSGLPGRHAARAILKDVKKGRVAA